LAPISRISFLHTNLLYASKIGETEKERDRESEREKERGR